MDDIFVAQLMTTSLKTVSPDTLVEEAANIMMDEDIGSVLVVDDDGSLEGILTTTDFVSIVANQHPKDETPVSAYMTSDVVTCEAGEDIRDAADRMITYSIHHLPVVDEEEGLIGIVTTTDLAVYLSNVQTPSPAE